MGFTKLDDAFASSSIFSLGLSVVGFWAYLMSQADSRGVVRATVPDMAARCRVTPEQVEEFLSLLQQPDRWSRTPDNEGRRIAVVREPEWAVILLNHGKYRERDHTATERQRRHRLSRRDTRDVTPETVTSRKQKTEAEAETERRKEQPPALPPADRAERAIRQSTDALRTRLYALVSEMVEADPKQRDPTELMRLVTAYEKQDGSRVRGVVNAALLSHERLERSIADAEAQLEEWRQPDGAGA